MNAIGWMMRTPDGGRSIWALYGSVILYAGFDQSEVWQSVPQSRAEAEQYLIDQTAKVEEKGSRLVRGPVEFDLTPEAIATILDSPGDRWTFAPLLNKELTRALEPPLNLPTGAGYAYGLTSGDFRWDPSTSAVQVFDGSAWIELGSAAARYVPPLGGATLSD